MENYVWLAIAAATSLAIFMIWVWRGQRHGDFPHRGRMRHNGMLAETEPPRPLGIDGDQPSASSHGRG